MRRGHGPYGLPALTDGHGAADAAWRRVACEQNKEKKFMLQNDNVLCLNPKYRGVPSFEKC